MFSALSFKNMRVFVRPAMGAAAAVIVAGSPAAASESPAGAAAPIVPAPQAADGELLPSAQLPSVGSAVTGPEAQADSGALDNGLGSAGQDRQFQQLFASWETTAPGQAVTTNVSIPSGMPLAGARMSSGYGMRNHPVLRRRARHKGVDLAAPTGTPVYATADGTVGRADWFSSYGLFIKIEHGGALETRYAHLSKLAVNAGEAVRKGDLIGYVGSTGRSTGPHLHYEVRVDGQAVNPMPFMKETSPVVALEQATGDAARAVGGAE
jgi:murein DD-endopeptidase MepM/ murein hydrolase activator NlpD